eukprot:CAMPEP_0205802664 /NCGR_PEP_ID=MMETSP0205-20121125/5079_1 /ASSEMBLY_ACC=CAM_ASM_000278 /TAXON_ID=36767 /ORGANISM="Euplotes focardii, Strain TN1" /LENGTH=296 /DNA_ID=CAMNT_0053069491 /DNA_START=516 /DNA_END=1403 /DNA_ORIENTATION=+
MEAKLNRISPINRDILEALINHNATEEKKMTDDEIKINIERSFISHPLKNFSDLPRYNYLEVKFFSEYIPQLGFSTGVDFIVNSPTKSLYYVVISLAPPGRLYQSDKKPLGLLETHAATDVQTSYKINFDSPQKAINFIDEIKRFYITKPDYSTILLYEIFQVNFGKIGIEKVIPFGFSFLPLFQYVEMEGNDYTPDKSLETYINTAIHQLLVFKGRPTEEFIQKATNAENFTGFLNGQIEGGALESIPKMSLIVRLYDNQFENIFTDPEDAYEKIEQKYFIIKNRKSVKFTYKKN